MKISDARRFSEALGSWLHFEACCFRAGLFSESSFKTAIGNVASSLNAAHPAARVRADYELPSIQRVPDSEKKLTGGRKRSVDFALIYDDGRETPSSPEFLIEAKWAGSSHCSVSNIIADFIRLAIMKKAHPDAICLFVLAGRHLDVQRVTSKLPFEGGTSRKDSVGNAKNMKKFAFRPSSADHQKLFGPAINAFISSNLQVPSGFTSIGAARYPPQSGNSTVRFQSAAWEIYYVPTEILDPRDWPPPAKGTRRYREQEEIA